MGSPISFRDDYALVFQQEIGAFRESRDSEAMTSKAISEDRISVLPDALLCHILSNIPTKEVVRTSILSKRWKDIWAYVPNWTLNCDEFPSSAEFIEFVNRALLIRDSAPIQKFHLDFFGCLAEDFSTIDRWICTAVRCNVVDLDLSIVSFFVGKELFEFPESLLTCKTLQVWKLYLNEAVKIPTLGCLPSLKSLHLEFSIASSDSMDISHCPVLEYLEISGCQGHYNFNCNISAPALKTLRISLGNEYIDRESNNYLINAPQLEKLDVDEDFLSNYTFENTQSLVEANARVFSTEDDEEDGSDDEEHAWASRATQFLAGISGVKCLTLPAPFSTGCSVAAFENLNKLTLVRKDHLRWWKILWKFLERTPHLKCLVINDDGFCNRWFSYPSSVRVEKEKRSANLECFVFYHERRMYPDDPRCKRSRRSNYVVNDMPFWSPPTMVPKCLLSSLNTISIRGFLFEKRLGYLDEMEMIKYLLKHGRVLEKVAIHATDGLLLEKYTPDRFWSGTKADFCDEIALSELGSKNVRVELMERLLYLQHEDA